VSDKRRGGEKERGGEGKGVKGRIGGREKEGGE